MEEISLNRTALFASARDIYYEYTLVDKDDNPIGEIAIEDGKITFDSSSDVMRTFKGTCRKSSLLNIDEVDCRLIPWMCVNYYDPKIGEVTDRYPLGKFIIEPSEEGRSLTSSVKIIGYDLGKIALDDKTDTRIYMSANIAYTSFAQYIAESMYKNIVFKASAKSKNSEAEWKIGTSKLTVINDLLKAISYNPLHFNERGIGFFDEYIEPKLRPVSYTYKTDDNSIILDGIEKKSTKFEIPNKYIRYVENVDNSYLISIYVNDDPNSQYSTVTRGRTITDVAAVEDIASQSDLDALVSRIALENMQSTETIKFSTLNVPGHDYKNILYVSIPEYSIEGKYIETKWEMDLSNGTMTHYCERVIV